MSEEKAQPGIKIICDNRKARHNYFLEDRYEAGLVAKLYGKMETKGYSLIPVKMYFKKGKAKIELALARGKKAHDKRASIKEREMKKQMQQLARKSR